MDYFKLNGADKRLKIADKKKVFHTKAFLLMKLNSTVIFLEQLLKAYRKKVFKK